LNSPITIGTAILCGGCFASGAGAQEQSYYFGRTTDLTPVEVALQDRGELIRFKIPKVYMTFSDNWQGGVQDFIHMQTIFPSMAPLSATRSSERGADVVIIDLMSHGSTEGDNNVSRSLKWEIATQWTLMERTADRSGEKYLVYVDKGKEKTWYMRNVIMKEYLVPDLGGDQPDIYFDCLRVEENPGAGCGGQSNFGHNLSLEFIFSRHQLHRWREIQEAVVNLLNGFRLEPKR